MNSNIYKYEDLLFSFLYRDEEFPAVKKSKGFSWKKILKVIYISLIDEIKSSFKSNDKILDSKIWLYVESINQLKSLEAISSVENTILITSSDKLINKNLNDSLLKIHLKTRLKNRLQRLFYFNNYNKLFGSRYKDHLATIIRYDGLYESLIDLLKKHKPKAIVFSNDHNAFCRALLIAAKDLKIKTIYIQHAAVTNRFPPLKFDLSLLEGKDSLKKYSEAGPIQGKVDLVGMLKFDEYFKDINRNKRIESLGIALNGSDDFKAYFKLFDFVYKEFKDLEYHIRFHPSIKVDSLSIPPYFKISKVEQENSFEFLKKIDLLFSGNSSIHLEAALMNIPSLQINDLNMVEKDYYGFSLNGLIEKIEPLELSEWLQKNISLKPEVRARAKFYVDTVDTKWDGESLTLVKKQLKQYLWSRKQ